MKAGKTHEVPLTERMDQILEEAGSIKLDNGLVFPSGINGKVLSNNTLRVALQKRLGVDGTFHCMRSAFKKLLPVKTLYARHFLKNNPCMYRTTNDCPFTSNRQSPYQSKDVLCQQQNPTKALMR